MASEVTIGVAGASGRMGRAVIAAVLAEPRAALAGGAVRPGSVAAGGPIRDTGGGETGLAFSGDAPALFAESDVVIDFSAPDATAAFAALAAESGTPLIVGTTGITAEDQARLEEAARTVAVLQAPNFSLGINLLARLVREAAARLGEEFDIEILEMHHRYKRDAPSGTALALGHAAGEGRGLARRQVEEAARRLDRTGVRAPGAIGFSVLRGGDVAGEHAVIFAGPEERLELGHRAGSRAIFARGAVTAALWLAGRPPGRYSLEDLLSDHGR